MQARCDSCACRTCSSVAAAPWRRAGCRRIRREPPRRAPALVLGCHAASAGVETPVPRLDGRNAAEIVDADAGIPDRASSQSTVMDRIAKGFTDAEIQAIAAWYAQQK